MRLTILLLFLFSCSENNTEYFPLDKIKSWSYRVEIIPEIENKITYKKTNLSIGRRNLIINNEKKILFPIIREDGSSLFYEVEKDGVYRVGKKFLKEHNINIEEKRMVLPKPITIGKSWNVNSETYLILRRYPYYDYRATTKFKLKYKIESMKQIVSTPIGVFKDCILVVGKGETNFIGDRLYKN